MIKTSEWVSLGHPDKVADYISCFLLDRYLERDPKTRFAVEVQIKGRFVTLGGEITSKAVFSDSEIAKFVRAAVREVGYTSAYQQYWGEGNSISADEILVTSHITRQSSEIGQGVDANGWGDQGIFHGMAVNNPETDYMPKDWWLARKIGKHLYDIRYAGIDIKTQVTMRDGKIDEVVVAIPTKERHFSYDIENAVRFCCGRENDFPVIINGTGRYIQHGPIADCGMTGRKLAVDFYGGNCKIGGGSPWTKDGTKADLTLNILARKKALAYLKAFPDLPEVHCAISCRIGSPRIVLSISDDHNNELLTDITEIQPDELIRDFRLREPRFADMCRNGLFS